MSTQTAPTQEEIQALKGSDLDAAIQEACIDASTGGSTSSGALSAEEKRVALQNHYGVEPSDPDSRPASTGDASDDEETGGETPQAEVPDPQTPSGDEPRPGAGAPGANPDTPSDQDQPTVDEQREKQLKAGQVSGKLKAAAARRAAGTPAEQRSVPGAKPTEGRVDNMTRRDDRDVLQGHFCLIDFGDDEFGEDAVRAVEAIVGEGNAFRGSADYGVYVEPGDLDEDGYPLTGTVLLRDEHSALVPGVPYRALLPAQAGGRR